MQTNVASIIHPPRKAHPRKKKRRVRYQRYKKAKNHHKNIFLLVGENSISVLFPFHHVASKVFQLHKNKKKKKYGKQNEGRGGIL